MKIEQDSSICAQCALVNPTCCRLSAGQEDLCFPVSEIERQRIVEFGPSMGGLTGARNSTAFLDSMIRLFPGSRTLVTGRFPPRGEHLRLATHPDGRCSFLGPRGCILPREARPYYCRLFPFWVTAGAVTAFDARGCLARDTGKSVAGMLSLFGLTRAMVRQLHGRMLLAWGLAPGEGPDETGPIRPRVVQDA